MWYLAALFFWRLLTPAFTRLPAGRRGRRSRSRSAWSPGIWAGDTFDVARILGLLPFFVLGLHVTPGAAGARSSPPARRWVAAAVLASVSCVLAIWTDSLASTEWLYYRARYDELDVSDARGPADPGRGAGRGRASARGRSSPCCRGAGGWFTRMGAFTLVVYLLHGFVGAGRRVRRAARLGGAHARARRSSWSASRAVGLALLLAWRPLASRLQHLVDPFGLAEREVRKAVDVTVAQEDVGVGQHFDEDAAR